MRIIGMLLSMCDGEALKRSCEDKPPADRTRRPTSLEAGVALERSLSITFSLHLTQEQFGLKG